MAKRPKPTPTPPPPPAVEDLTADELEYLGAAFQLIDENEDGLIDTSDLGRLFKRLNMSVKQDELEAMIAAQRDADSKSKTTSRPGCLDFVGFCAMMQRAGLRKGADAEIATQIFGVMDKNRDGRISASELREIMGAVGVTLGDEQLLSMFKAADTDKDGHISYDEFAEMIKLLQKQEQEQQEQKQQEQKQQKQEQEAKKQEQKHQKLPQKKKK